jgi:hypothetical protein
VYLRIEHLGASAVFMDWMIGVERRESSLRHEHERFFSFDFGECTAFTGYIAEEAWFFICHEDKLDRPSSGTETVVVVFIQMSGIAKDLTSTEYRGRMVSI